MRAEASVDVVVPNYGHGRFLEACVASVLAQEIPDLRVLVVDNASPDDSLAVARRLAAADSRVTVLAREVNLGPHASFNAGVDWAQAAYFAVLCADDLMAPGALRRAVALMRDAPDVHLVFGALGGPSDPAPSDADDPSWRITAGRDLIERFCRTGSNHLPTLAVVRTAVQKRVGHYRPALVHADDLEMWMRIALHGRVAETALVHSVTRDHAARQSSSVRNALDWYREFLAAFESFFSTEGATMSDAARLRRLARRSLAGRAYWCALAAFLRRRPAEARAFLGFALATCPRLAVAPPIADLVRRPDAGARVAAAIAAGLGRTPHA